MDPACRKVSLYSLNKDCISQLLTYLPVLDQLSMSKVNRHCRRLIKSAAKIKKLNLSVFANSEKHSYSLIDKRKNIFKQILQVFKLVHYVVIDEDVLYEFIETKYKTKLTTKCKEILYIILTAVIEDKTNIKTFWVRRRFDQSSYDIKSYENLLKKIFNKNENLRSLILVNNQITGNCLMYLPTTVTDIQLYDCSSLDFNITIESLRQLINLEILCLSNVGISDVFFNEITNLPRMDVLIELNLSLNSEVDDNKLRTIGERCQNLVKLTINECPITDAGIEVIGLNFHTLRDLSVEHTNITGQSLRTLNNLKFLNCANCVNLMEVNVIEFLQQVLICECLDLAECGLITNTFIDYIINRRSDISVMVYLYGTHATKQYYINQNVITNNILIFNDAQQVLS